MNNLINSNYLLLDAQKKGYAIPAFNVHNLETVHVVLDTARELESPVILAGTPGTYSYAGIQEMIQLVNAAAKERHQQVVLHLDHHHDLKDIQYKVESGIRSAMIDGSALALDENIALTQKAVKLCHAYGCSVEAEIGQLIGQEDDLIIEEVNDPYTVPEDAKKLVEMTNVDSLAIAIGTAHGMYKETPKLDFARLEKIASLIDIPLVLHGASGVPHDDVKRCISMGICKVNVATELKIAYADALKSLFATNPSVNDPREYNVAAKAAMAEVIKQKITVCNSQGRL
ncbi:tagatose-bisphosphate aldolase subunit GatY [Photobacterium sagamiensis]|uniref:tagatose-bisphosphate aldolase subunit GatY n=1 Tax=Photobacterium sagamiensis TaxID=2910241 RepID=UPI003D0A44A8